MTAAVATIRLISRDAAALAAFYQRAFGFRAADAVGADDPFCALRRIVTLTLGAQRLQITEPEGGALTSAAAGVDCGFQHFAMVVPEIGPALAALERSPGWTPITEGGPQALPGASGGVTAFKFRDPEGHPLELLRFPDGRIPEAWRAAREANPGSTVLGIDHTAIVVGDTERSAAFYRDLGFRRTGATLNRGPEQARLDGVADPVVEVTALDIQGAGPPHLELLCYRGMAPGDHSRGDRDLLATRTLTGASDARGKGVRDPDGHRWILGSPDPGQAGATP